MNGDRERTVVDSLGRVRLPLRSQGSPGIDPGDWVEFLLTPEGLVLRRVTVVAPADASAAAAADGDGSADSPQAAGGTDEEQAAPARG